MRVSHDDPRYSFPECDGFYEQMEFDAHQHDGFVAVAKRRKIFSDENARTIPERLPRCLRLSELYQRYERVSISVGNCQVADLQSLIHPRHDVTVAGGVERKLRLPFTNFEQRYHAIHRNANTKQV